MTLWEIIFFDGIICIINAPHCGTKLYIVSYSILHPYVVLNLVGDQLFLYDVFTKDNIQFDSLISFNNGDYIWNNTETPMLLFIDGQLVDGSPFPQETIVMVIYAPRYKTTFKFWQAQHYCVHPETLVETKNGQKHIKDIKKNDLVKDFNGNYIEVIHNI